KQNIAVLADLDANVRTPAVITDTGSTKRGIVSAAAALPPRFAFVGGHPLAGAAHGGLEHARTDLFVGRPWILTTSARSEGRALQEGVNGSGRPEGRALRAGDSRGPSGRPEPADAPEPRAALERLAAFVRALGAEPRVVDADAHDRMLAFLSHLPQLTASAPMQVVGSP